MWRRVQSVGQIGRGVWQRVQSVGQIGREVWRHVQSVGQIEPVACSKYLAFKKKLDLSIDPCEGSLLAATGGLQLLR